MSSRSSGPMLFRLLAVCCAVLLFVGSGLGARPAAAAVFTVSSPQELADAFDNAAGPDHQVVLAADITVPDTGPAIGVPSGQSVTLDLNGFSLDITGVSDNPGIEVSTTAALSVTDGVGGGSLTVMGAPNHAGIGGLLAQPAGAITITGGTVTATGGEYAAGIGGSQGGSGGAIDIRAGAVTATGGTGAAGIGGGATGAGGDVTISGGTVAATGGIEGAGIGGGNRAAGGGSVTIQAGTVTALGGVHAAGIGGGALTPGGDVVIGTAANVTAVPVGSASAVGPGATNVEGEVLGFGSLTNAGMLTTPSPALTIPAGVVVSNSGTIRNGGVLTGEGTINNTGTIVNTGSGSVAETLTVTGHSYLLQFDALGGAPETEDQEVYAATLALAEEVLPAAPVREGYQFTGWYLQQDASGSPVSTSTPLGTGNGPTTVSLYAGWVADAVLTTLTINPSTAQIVAGGSAEFTVTGQDQNGQPMDVSAAVLTSSNPDDQVAGRSVKATSVGDRTITATLGDLQATASLGVTAGVVANLTLEVSGDAEVVAGTQVDLVVSATDAFGNPVDASGVVISSSVDSDTVDGLSVTPMIVGDRTLTATLGELQATAPLSVVAAAATSLTLQVTGEAEVVAGTQVDLGVSATDAYGNPVDASGVVISSSVGSDAIEGLAVTPTVAGDRTLTATLGDLQATTALTTTPGAPAELTVWIDEGETPVPVGGSLTLGVSATDEFGNPVDTNGVVVTSSVATDVVDGLSVQFPTASPHVLTVTLGDVSTSLTVEVDPGTPPADDEPANDEPADDEPADVEPAGEEPAGSGPTAPGEVLPPLGSSAELGAGLVAAVLFVVTGVAVLVRARRTGR